MKGVLDFLNAKMTEPTLYGWYHLLCWGIVIVASIIVVVYRKKFSKKFVNNFLLITGLVFFVLEIYKLVIISYDDNGLTKFLWYTFPFQVCSTPMYLSIIAGSLRKGRAYDYITSYLATYSVFAGLAVMILPSTVFVSIIGVNIQTMVVHGGMVIMGIMLLSTKTVKIEWKTLLKGGIVFCLLSLIAILLNVLWHFYGTSATFNMFFISPWGECDLPIINLVQDNAPYIIFLLSYYIEFVVCSAVVLSIAIIIDKINSKRNNDSQ